MAKLYYPNARVKLNVVLDDYRDTDPDPKDALTFWVLPRSVTVVKNSSNQADSFSITIDSDDFPFLPSQIRSGGAEVYLYQTDGINQEEFMPSRQEVGSLPGPDKSDSIFTQDGVANLKEIRARSNWPIVVGTFDEVDIEYSEDGRTFQISGQDYTAHLQSIQWPPTAKGGPRRVTPGKRIDRWLQEVLLEVTPSGTLRVALEDISENDLPTVGKGFVNAQNGIAIEQDTKYWDVINKVARLHGLLAYVDGTFVILKGVRGQKAEDKKIVYSLSWKENISNLKVSKELSKERPPQIIVQSYDPKTKKVVIGEYPPGANVRRTASKKDPTLTFGGKAGQKKNQVTKASEEFEVIPAQAAISDVNRLNVMARMIYEQRARGQMEMVVSTSDLADSLGSDLLKLKADDIMQINFDPFDRNSLTGNDENDPFNSTDVTISDRAEILRGQGYSYDVANYIAANFERLDQLRRPFIVNEVNFDYSVEDGISIEIQLIEAVNAGSTKQPETREAVRKAKFDKPDVTRARR